MADPGASRRRRSLLAGDGSAATLAAPLEAAAVLEGWRGEARGDWGAVRALEPRLAALEVLASLPKDAISPQEREELTSKLRNALR